MVRWLTSHTLKDLVVDDIKGIDEKQLHRNVDLKYVGPHCKCSITDIIPNLL